MKLRNIGYACINLSLEQTTNKTFRLKNLTKEKYMETVSYNLNSLKNIILWNAANNIKFFRIGSEIIPFASHADFKWNWKKDFQKELNLIRKLVEKTNTRLTMHPGQYTVLNSPRKEVVFNAVKEINYHADFLNEVYPEKGKIVIHAGGVYGDKKSAAENFINNFFKLPLKTRKMLILENDDKSYTARDILDICRKIKIPCVFDMLHHICLYKGKNPYDNLNRIIKEIAASWGKDIPVFHFSSRKTKINCSHSPFIIKKDFNKFVSFLEKATPLKKEYDVMIEAKMKDKAALKLINLK